MNSTPTKFPSPSSPNPLSKSVGWPKKKTRNSSSNVNDPTPHPSEPATPLHITLKFHHLLSLPISSLLFLTPILHCQDPTSQYWPGLFLFVENSFVFNQFLIYVFWLSATPLSSSCYFFFLVSRPQPPNSSRSSSSTNLFPHPQWIQYCSFFESCFFSLSAMFSRI